MHTWKATMAAVLFYAVWPTTTPSSIAADHRDGPAAKNDPTADISDVFAFPIDGDDGSRRLVLAMALHPYAGDEATFSDQVEHVFRIRPASIAGNDADTAIKTDDAETRVSCRITGDGGEKRMACSVEGACGDACPKTAVRIDDETGGSEPALRVFAGLRSDPFFSDVARVRLPRLRDVDLNTPGINTFGLANVLVLVAEIDVGLLGDAGATYAVVAETQVPSEVTP